MVDRPAHYMLPIVFSLMTTTYKFQRTLHCIFCGFPFIAISDDIVSITDSPMAVGDLNDAAPGPIQSQCPRHTCKQRYRLEFAA